MIAFLKCSNDDLLEIIDTNIPSVFDATGNLLPRDIWCAYQKYKYQLNVKVEHTLICVIFEEEIAKVYVV